MTGLKEAVAMGKSIYRNARNRKIESIEQLADYTVPNVSMDKIHLLALQKANNKGLEIAFNKKTTMKAALVLFQREREFYIKDCCTSMVDFVSLVIDNWESFSRSEKNFWGGNPELVDFNRIFLNSIPLVAFKEYMMNKDVYDNAGKSFAESGTSFEDDNNNDYIIKEI